MSYAGPQRKLKKPPVSVEIDQESLTQLRDLFASVPDRVERKLGSKATRRAAKIIAGELKGSILPIGKKRKKTPGAEPVKKIRKTVKPKALKKSRRWFGMMIWVKSPYAVNLNYGTKHIAPGDYLGEAERRKRKEAIDILVASLRELVGEMNKGQ